VNPKTAVSVGLNVDIDARAEAPVKQVKESKDNLTDPTTTLALLSLKLILGVTDHFNDGGSLLRRA
jgi:hypothetical protein